MHSGKAILVTDTTSLRYYPTNYRIVIENAIGADQQTPLQRLTLTLKDQLDITLSNIGKIEITTPCVCSDYTEKSVPSLTVLGAFLFFMLFSVVAIRFIAQSKKETCKKQT